MILPLTITVNRTSYVSLRKHLKLHIIFKIVSRKEIHRLKNEELTRSPNGT